MTSFERPLVCLFCLGALGFVLFQIVTCLTAVNSVKCFLFDVSISLAIVVSEINSRLDLCAFPQ